MSSQVKSLICGRFSLSLSKPLIMGILNVTPDSFSDGGQFSNFDSAVIHAQKMVEDGADIIDVGGESTRPGADAVSVDMELQRVIPVIEKLSQEIDIPISIDTSKATVMYEAIHAGASMINDVCALQNEDSMSVAASLDVPICLMHMQGTPVSMQKNIAYQNVVNDVLEFLEQRIKACVAAGVTKNNIIIDPGFGFGKTLEHNLALLDSLAAFADLGYPVLAGLSRKSMLESLSGRAVNNRLAGSLALALIAVNNGASILRVHDVAESRDFLAVSQAYDTFADQNISG